MLVCEKQTTNGKGNDKLSRLSLIKRLPFNRAAFYVGGKKEVKLMCDDITREMTHK